METAPMPLWSMGVSAPMVPLPCLCTFNMNTITKDRHQKIVSLKII